MNAVSCSVTAIVMVALAAACRSTPPVSATVTGPKDGDTVTGTAVHVTLEMSGIELAPAADQRPGTRNGCKVVAEKHPFVGRVVVLPVIKTVRRRRAGIVQSQHLACDETAVIPIRDSKETDHADDKPEGGVAWRRGWRPAVVAQGDPRRPGEHGGGGEEDDDADGVVIQGLEHAAVRQIVQGAGDAAARAMRAGGDVPETGREQAAGDGGIA